MWAEDSWWIRIYVEHTFSGHRLSDKTRKQDLAELQKGKIGFEIISSPAIEYSEGVKT